MLVQYKISTMYSFYLILNMMFLIVHPEVNAFHAAKPMIYINFFDEVLTDNSTSKLNENVTTLASSNNKSAEDIKKKTDLSVELLKINEEHNSSAPAPYDSIFEFDDPSKADITETSSVVESDIDSSTKSREVDLMDPEFLAPDIGRIFFLRAITNLIQHIMEAFFSIDDTAKLNEPHGFDYDSAPSRKMKKRELSNMDGSTKMINVDHTSENSTSDQHSTEFKTISPNVDTSSKDISASASLITDKKNTVSAITEGKINESVEILEKTNKNLTEQKPYITLTSQHVTKDTNEMSHSTLEANEPKSTNNAESNTKSNINLKEHTNSQLQKQLAPTDEEDTKMFRFSDENSVLHDEVANKKEPHFSEEDDKCELDEKLPAYGHQPEGSSSLVTVLLISITIMILLLIVGFGAAAAYFYRKSKVQSASQDSSTNTRSSIA